MQNRYNYTYDPFSNSYNFITKNDVLYRVAFVTDETLSSISGTKIPHVFQLVVEKINKEKESLDTKVSKTIELIVVAFLNEVKNSVIYVCSDNEDKALIRFKVFNRWYQNSKHNAYILKIDNVIPIKTAHKQEMKLYTSFILHKNNPNYTQVVKLYHQIEKTLNEEDKNDI
ncbi:MAG: hypothetical protein KF900_00120 [Bacteroidetes bacterium]|nr:hypothetical protein [Bacteroidota bacterium]